MKRILVAAFSEIPALSFESETATEIAKAFEGWCEVDVVAPMVAASAHLEAFHGGRLHRVAVGGAEDVLAAADIFERALERQLDSTPYDAVHLLSPVGVRAVGGRATGGLRVVAEIQPLPALAPRLGGDSREWLDRLREDEAAALEVAALLALHDAADSSAIRYRRRLAPHALLPEPVDTDAYHWEQLVPARAPVVLVLDPGFGASRRFEMLQPLDALDRASGAVVWRLALPTARIQTGVGEPETALPEWTSGRADAPARLRVAARTALNAADVVVLPHPPEWDDCGLTVSGRRWGALQAAACRKPLVISDSPRFPTPNELSEHVFRFPTGDWNAMTQTVRSVLIHPAKAIQVANRAWRKTTAAGAPEYRRRLRALYAGLLGHDPDRPGPMPVRSGSPAPSAPQAA